MRLFPTLALAAIISMGIAPGKLVGETLIEYFTIPSDARWRFFSDEVMGGVSTAQMATLEGNGQSFARLTGRVSTANNGGFIQMRLDLPAAKPEGTTGVRLVVRGNDQRYFVHLRTRGALLPWKYYQAPFDVTGDWSEERIPLDGFIASGKLLQRVPRAGSFCSIAIVAFGRSHEARMDVREIAF